MEVDNEPVENDGAPPSSNNMLAASTIPETEQMVTEKASRVSDTMPVVTTTTGGTLAEQSTDGVVDHAPQMVETGEVMEGMKEQSMEGVTDDAPLVAETSEPMEGLDKQSQQVLDETTQIGETVLGAGEMDVSTAPAEPGVIQAGATLATDDLMAKDFADAASKQKDDPQAEWQLDSSDEDSDDSDDTSSDDPDDSDDEYALLDPATAARMLMAGDGDDDDNDKKGKSSGVEHQPRTANEVKEDIVARPEIEITPSMQITALGKIEGIIENNILIRGHTSGEFQVLEPGSVLCNADRKVVGVVADLFGRVQQPMYSVMFNTAQEELAKELGLVTGSELFYVNDHSKFVFTQPLRNMKGTDASNIHDEEVGEDEIEFSDDEKEAEYKRQKKLAKKAGRGGLSRGAFHEGERVAASRPTSRDAPTGYIRSSDAPSTSYGGGMNYDDEGGDGFYQPLRRPDNLAAMMSAPPGRRDESTRSRGRGRGGDRGRGRGDRGRGRGGQRDYNDRPRHQLPPAPAVPAAPYQPPAPAPNGYAAASAQYGQPQPTYQFNGYTFQYGHGQGPPPQYPAQPQYAQYQQAPAAGAYANPAYYGAYQQAGYAQPSAHHAASYQQQPVSQAAAYQQQPVSQAAAYQQQMVAQAAAYQQQPVSQAAAYQQQPASQAAAYQAQTAVQPAPYGQGAAQLTPAQQHDLAEVMRRLGQYPPQA